MPDGLADTLSVFQSLVNDILHDLLGKLIISYINIWIESPCRVRQVLQKLRVKASSCKRRDVSRSWVSTNRISVKEDKVKAVAELTANSKGIKRFLGFARSYWRFIQNIMAAPLRERSRISCLLVGIFLPCLTLISHFSPAVFLYFWLLIIY